MAIKQPTRILMSFLAVLAHMSAIAMDLTIAPASTARMSATSGKPAAKSRSIQPMAKDLIVRSEAAKSDRGKGAAGEGSKPGRREKLRRRKITTYSLFGAQDARQGHALTGGLPGLAAAGSFARQEYGDGRLAPNAGLNTSSIVAIKPQPAEGAGIAFDCREKSSLATREVTACYVHKVDKAWKTQTYVTKKLADSSPGWGGGLAVGYAY